MPRGRQLNPVDLPAPVNQPPCLVRPKEKGEDQSVLEYLSYFKRIMKVNHWEDDIAGDIFLSLLGPKDHTASMLEGQWEGFQELEQLLYKQEEPMREANLKQLMEIRLCEGESISSLRNRVVHLVSLVYGKTSSMTQLQLARDHFLFALPSKVKDHVLSSRPISLEDTVSVAASLFDSFSISTLQNKTRQEKQEYNSSANRSDVRCSLCHRLGHFSRNCRSSQRQIRCFRCSRIGHLSRDCSVKLDEINVIPENETRLLKMEEALQSPERQSPLDTRKIVL